MGRVQQRECNNNKKNVQLLEQDQICLWKCSHNAIYINSNASNKTVASQILSFNCNKIKILRQDTSLWTAVPVESLWARSAVFLSMVVYYL